MESIIGKDSNERVPLSDVVADCVKRWFKDTLKEARAGDVNMQILVGQMYCNGYGVPKDFQKGFGVSGFKAQQAWAVIAEGKVWLTKASRVRSSVWKVGDKRPGYNASDSDSDSDELNEDS